MRAIMLQSAALLMALAVSGAAATEPEPAAGVADPPAAVVPAVDGVAAVLPYDSNGRRDPFRPFMLDMRTDRPQVSPLQRYELGRTHGGGHGVGS